MQQQSGHGGGGQREIAPQKESPEIVASKEIKPIHSTSSFSIMVETLYIGYNWGVGGYQKNKSAY